jgi:hypothetical protein
MAVTRRLIIAASLAVGYLVFCAQPISACDCHDGGPVCQAFWETPVIFVGRVEAVTIVRRAWSTESYARARFRVMESLRGTSAREVDIGSSSDSCGLRFAVGEDWIIYAWHSKGGGLSTGTCSRSRQLHNAAEDLAYGRAAFSRSVDKGRIFGRLTYHTHTDEFGVPGARVTLRGSGFGQATAVTDREGRYELMVPAGRYQVTAALPPGLTMPHGARVIELPDNRGCVEANLWADYPGRVTGRVVDDSGTAVPNLTVELIAADTWDVPGSRLRGVTDLSGRYSISGVVPGSYVVGVVAGSKREPDGFDPQYLFAGGAITKTRARRVEVRGGRERAVGDLTLPRGVRIVQIRGIVVDMNGRPAAGVKVRTKADFDDSSFPWTTIRTDTRGEFSFALAEGLRHRLVAEPPDVVAPSSRQVAAMTIDPSRPIPRLRLVLP